MKSFTIGPNDAGQRLDRFLSKTVPLLPSALQQKYIRLKRVKLNGKRAQRDTRLNEGDLIELYINDEFFAVPEHRPDRFLSALKPRLNILYEDANILLLDKPAGQVVHADETEKVHTLINEVQAYLYQKGEWDPAEENAFAPALCNRIDRNTAGIVIAAKNAEALRVIDQKIRDHELEKSYLCVTVGTPKPVSGAVNGFLKKDEANKLVTFYNRPVPGGRSCSTDYRTLETRSFGKQGTLSLVECTLHTGRTHQIRVSMGHIGAPILGDGKYGNGAVNRSFHETRQNLCAYRLTFRFTTDAGSLSYLNGRSFTVKRVPFRELYFPQS